MRIGISIAAGGPIASFDDALRRVIQAEKDGFESVWFNSGAAGEPLTVIAVAGRETSRIEFMTAVAVTYTRHPVLMAQQALTANAATGGRLVLGLGPSHRPGIERLGLDYGRAGVHTREYVTVVRSLMTEGRVDFRGEFFRVEATQQLSWGSPCPIVISALAPYMLKAAGEIADGTVTWMVGPKTLRSHIVPRLRAAAAAAGRPEPRVCVGLPVCVCDDQRAARQRASELFQMYASMPNYKRVLDIEGTDAGGVAVCGTETEVEAQLRELAAAGATEFNGNPFAFGDNPAASFARTRELLASLVGKL